MNREGAPNPNGGGDGAGANKGRLHRRIVDALMSYQATSEIRNELDLEASICEYMAGERYVVRRQVIGGRGHNRYDIVCEHPLVPGERVCVECKLKATASDFEQFDRYIEQFPDGVVVACWSATSSVQATVEAVNAESAVRIALVEVGLQHALA